MHACVQNSTFTYIHTHINKYAESCIHFHTYIHNICMMHTYIHKYIQKCIHKYIHTYVRFIHTYIRMIHTCKINIHCSRHACMAASTHRVQAACATSIHTHIHTNSCIHTYIHKYICIHRQEVTLRISLHATYMYTYIHTHTYVHMNFHSCINSHIHKSTQCRKPAQQTMVPRRQIRSVRALGRVQPARTRRVDTRKRQDYAG